MISKPLFLLCLSIWFGVGKSQLSAVFCLNNFTYDLKTSNGRDYRANLESLLESLASKAYQPSGFVNDLAGSGQATVHGQFLCRGDIMPSDCQTCLNTATADILQECPDQLRAVIWYDNCMVRFSDQTILHRLDAGYSYDRTSYLWDQAKVSNAPLLNKVRNQTFEAIVTLAAISVDSEKKFAVREANYTASEKIYAMAQCTPDLTSWDCESCLSTAIDKLPGCCSGRLGGRVLYPSCNIRYESFRFYGTPQRLPPPPTDPARNQEKGGISKKAIVAIIIPTFVAFVGFVVVFLCLARKAQNKIRTARRFWKRPKMKDTKLGDQSLRYSFRQVQTFTNKFSVENRIGQGGFGPVYKGTLPDGQIVAVKRLSRNSSQGEQEFINEIALVAKLQHRNLVRLLGYCLEEEEKILIYEFVVNKSLDYFLFNPEKQPLLDWFTRYKIIRGIARGLLYLHEDSRIKIIHRDLKAGNILLDQNMNAKISDFGMARLFEIGQSEGKTTKIAGTFGYMAPEYVFQGMLSVKSDVFSFGVLVLEIISGKRTSNLQCFGDDDLLSFAWKQWMNKTPISLMDPTIGEFYDVNEVTSCIHIGLLCVVEEMERRPTMASIVHMLNSPFVPESTPNQPAFFGRSRIGNVHREIPSVTDSDKSSLHLGSSRNEVSLTEFYPR